MCQICCVFVYWWLTAVRGGLFSGWLTAVPEGPCRWSTGMSNGLSHWWLTSFCDGLLTGGWSEWADWHATDHGQASQWVAVAGFTDPSPSPPPPPCHSSSPPQPLSYRSPYLTVPHLTFPYHNLTVMVIAARTLCLLCSLWACFSQDFFF